MEDTHAFRLIEKEIKNSIEYYIYCPSFIGLVDDAGAVCIECIKQKTSSKTTDLTNKME
jgi:hypothetical protein